MQFQKVGKLLPAFIIILVLWLLTYTLYWVDRADCAATRAACVTGAFYGWVGDLIRFKWMDTTLGAGALAMIGAALVLVAALYQRRTAVIDAAEASRATLLALLGLASLRAQKLVGLLFENKNVEAAKVIANFDTDLSQLVSRAPGLAHWLQLIAAETDKFLEDIPGREIDEADTIQFLWHTKPDRWRAIAYAIVMEEFLENYERLVLPTGAYKHKPAPAQAVTKRLTTLSKIRLENLRYVDGMFH